MIVQRRTPLSTRWVVGSLERFEIAETLSSRGLQFVST